MSLASEEATPAPAFRARRRLRAPGRAILGLVLPLGFVAVWQAMASAGTIDLRLFPAPSEVLLDLVDLIRSGELLSNFLVSLGRATAGFACGASVGLLFGLLVGYSRLFESMLDPTFQMLRTVPLLAVTPLFILWLGFGDAAKITLIACGAFFPMYVNAFLGVRSVDTKLFDVTRVLEFSRWQQIRKVILPAAAPNILLGLRLSIGMAWLCLVVAELMGAQEGLGYMIQNARSLLDTPTVLVGVAAFALIGKASDSIVRLLERRLLGWRDDYQG
jgi:sulfonate transport system permease protein